MYADALRYLLNFWIYENKMQIKKMLNLLLIDSYGSWSLHFGYLNCIELNLLIIDNCAVKWSCYCHLIGFMGPFMEIQKEISIYKK